MRRAWEWLKNWPTWVWLLLFSISAIFAIHALRQNNYEMIRLRNGLYAADKSGQGVDGALNKLRQHVYSHMNTDLSGGSNPIKPPIQLKYTYDRLVKAEQVRVNQANDQIYSDAASYCRRNESGEYRQVCFDQYVDRHNVKAQPIPAALYQFDFLSPTWSPDGAGWSLVVAVLLGGISFVSLTADRRAVHKLKSNRKTPKP